MSNYHISQIDIELPDGITAWIVDGGEVRENCNIDYTLGGHGYVYPFIPKDEIWIDDDCAEDEAVYVLIHELHERALMKDGISYDEAHNQASAYEMLCREHPEKIDELLGTVEKENKVASMSPSWHLRVALSMMAFPRRPKLPEGITYRVTNPGYYNFQYPMPRNRIADITIDRRRARYDSWTDEESGAYEWFWNIFVATNETMTWLLDMPSEEEAQRLHFQKQPKFDTDDPFDLRGLAEAESDGGWPTLASALQDALLHAGLLAQEIQDHDEKTQAWLDSKKEPMDTQGNLRTAFPRRPQLPEGITYTSTEPGLYYFTYPLHGDRVANVCIMKEQEQDTDFNTFGPYMWAATIDIEGGKTPGYLQEKDMYRSLSEAVTRTIAALDTYNAKLQEREPE